MKTILTIITLLGVITTSGQSIRNYRSSIGSHENRFYDMDGIFEDDGKNTSVMDVYNSETDSMYLSIVYMDNYSFTTSKNFKIGSEAAIPTGLIKTNQYIYITLLMYPQKYGIFKLDPQGNTLAYKELNEVSGKQIKLHKIANSTDLLLTCHGLAADSTSQILIYSLNENLQPNPIHNISFTGAKAQGYTVGYDKNIDFILDGSELHYQLEFRKADSSRIEYGQINITSGNTETKYSKLTYAISGLYPAHIVKVSNDTTFSLINNSLVITPKNVSSAKHFQLGRIGKTCTDIAALPGNQWVGIHETWVDNDVYGAVTIFNCEDGEVVDVYQNEYIASNVKTRNNNVLLFSSSYRTNYAVEEFNMDNIDSCRLLTSTDTISMIEIAVSNSLVNITTPSALTFVDMAFPQEIEVNETKEVICNTHNLGVSENMYHDLSIYPNPTSDLVYIQMKNEPMTGISLKTLTGTMVWESNKTSGDQTIDMSTFPAGIYFVEVRTKTSSHVQKIIKQ